MIGKARGFGRRRGRRLPFALTLLAAIGVFSVFVAASGANLSGSTFEGNDGNMAVDHTGNTDWETSGLPVRTLTDLPSGSSDNSFGQGTKESDTHVTVVTGTIPPNKNDLLHSYVSTEAVGGQTFLYLAWVRAANTGDAHIDFELNQNTTPNFTENTVGAVTLNRTKGDLLISYDFSGSGTPDITLFTWNGTQWTDQQDLSAQGFAEAAVNASSITDAISGGTIAAGNFGEAAINLSSALKDLNVSTCEAFGSTWVKARASGSSTSAELKDFIAPAPIHVSNCGSIELQKHWIGAKGNVTLNVGTSAGKGDVATKSLQGTDGTTGPTTVENGTYFVSESFDSPTDSSDYDSGLVCTDNGQSVNNPGDGVDVSEGHTVVCTFTNTQHPHVTIEKLADDGNVSAGQDVGFTITVTNDGGSTAKNVAVSDTLPTGTATDWSVDTQSNASLCSITSGTLSCGPTDLAAGASFSVHITAKTSSEDCTTYDNTAHVTSDNGGSGQSEAVITCHQQAVHITKTADHATVNAGDDIGYTIVVSATGNDTAKNVSVSDPLPAGPTWSIDNNSNPSLLACSISNGTLSCGPADFQPGDSDTIHITATTSHDECSTYDNTATVTSDNAGTDKAEAVITCQNPTIHITKTADLTPVNAGDSLGYTVTVNATGAGTATNVKVNDPLPSGPSWSIDTQSNSGLCTIPGGTLTCGPTSLAASDSFSVHVTAKTSAQQCSTYDNTADVTTDNAGSDEASATITCRTTPPTTPPPSTPEIDLAITKSGAPNPASINGQITWTMVVTNNGPDAATGVTVSDPIPSSNTFVSASSTQGSCANNSGTVTCTIGGMANGASVTVTMVTTALVAGTVDNTATTKGNETETNTANNTASASVVVQALTPPKPSIVCSTINATPKLLYVGRHQTLTLHVTKKGKAAAGVHVRITGPGLHMKVGPSNAQGVIKVHVHPKKAGLVHFTAVTPQKSCGPARIGITNVFTPPVTG